MHRQIQLLVLIVGGSALCWWPVLMERRIDFPWWVVLVVVGLMTGLAVVLSGRNWLSFAMAAVVGAFSGMCSGFVLFPVSDGIARSYVPIVVVVLTVVVTFVALLSGFGARRLSGLLTIPRPVAWFALICCVAFGPVALALTPSLVAHRVASNDRVAEERITSLQAAVEGTLRAGGEASRICDGRMLRRNYSGPPFSDADWGRIAGNYVQEDGYAFMVHCREKSGYTINSIPVRGKADGTRRFCTDELRGIGCGMEWNGSRYACVACSK